MKGTRELFIAIVIMNGRRVIKIARLFPLLLLFILSGCDPQAYVSVKNDCGGVKFVMSKLEGNGNLTVYEGFLMPGERLLVELTGVASTRNRFVIMADAFRITDGKPLGSRERVLTVDSSGGQMTGPENNYSWEINQIFPGWCETQYR